MNNYRMAVEFTRNPGPRYKKLGEYSGEEFREDVLIPRLNELHSGEKLCINFDGLSGYPSSFFEEAFGGLVRHYKDRKFVKDHLEFECSDDAFFIEDLTGYIDNAEE